MIWKEHQSIFIKLLPLSLVLTTIPFLQSGVWALMINELVRVAGSKKFSEDLIFYTILALTIGAIPTFLYQIQTFLFTMFKYDIETYTELLIADKSSKIDIPIHESPEFNNKFSTIKEQGVWKFNMYIERLFFLFQNSLQLLLASSIIFYSKWWILIVVILGALPSLIIEVKFGKKVWGIWTGNAEIRRQHADIHWRFKFVNSLMELKTLQAVKYLLKKLNNLFVAFKNEEKKNQKRKLKQELFFSIFTSIFLAIPTVFYIYQVTIGAIEIGTFTFFTTAVISFSTALSSFFRNIGLQYSDNLFVSDLFDIIDLEPKIVTPKNAISLSNNKPDSIEFRNVYFKYPDAKEYALNNFSIKINPGEKIAIVGSNGAGKSTFLKLLCRFYDCEKGEILINNVNIKNIDLNTWHRKLGVLLQGFGNYFFPVKEGIALGKSEQKILIQDIKQSAREAKAHEFIEKWKFKYDQMLGKQFKDGVEPSWGQWQRLAIARTFYQDSKILILDEPTASLDSKSETLIFDYLNSRKEDTIILISHRFSTVRQAEKIYVFENGEVVEGGTHEELMNLNEIYYNLFTLQAEGYQ